jgi:CxxC-x17-CxxC domain-containing protein
MEAVDASSRAPPQGENASMFQDKTLRCRECGQDFIFSAGEQEFYQQRDLRNEPGRCPACRAAHRTVMAAARAAGERLPRELFKTTCAECGGEAQVPFVPKTEKPVYCSACFEKVRAAN